MGQRTITKTIILILFILTSKAYALETLVYTWRGYPGQEALAKRAAEDMAAHAAKIDIYSSEAYHIDQDGKVIGSLHPDMLNTAYKEKIKIMPLVGNLDLNPDVAHAFLTNSKAQERAIKTLLQLCKQYHFYGLQIDFEDMPSKDRELYSAFYTRIAHALHAEGFKISVAIIPTLSNDHTETTYLKRRYQNWSGVYDYKVLARNSDFITLMTYDQHGESTTPGPMSGYTWNEAIIKYALQYIPANKISLGIPLHSGYWYAGSTEGNKRIHMIGTTYTYHRVQLLLQDNKNIPLMWSNLDKMHYTFYPKHFLYEYLFIEDADSYQAKLDLVKKYHLRGLSNWCLGEEDPAIWNLL